MSTEPITIRLARFCRDLRFEALDKAVVTKIKQHILDQIGVEIACATLPWNRDLYRYIESSRASGKCTVVDYPLKTNIEYAVLANATFGHGFEIDDYVHTGRVGHVGAVTVPVAIALSETRPVSGKHMIEAIVSGYEIMAAIARGIQPSSIYGRGFHAQSTGGPFASAAVAGVILGEDVPTIANAFSLAASHAGGIMEYTNSGGNVKRLHAGMAAQGGVRCALLAQYGWSGPTTAIEGKRGFCVAFAPEYDIEAITRDLGKDYCILKSSLKRYCCNANIGPAIDALQAILAETPIGAEDIEEIEVRHSTNAGRAIVAIGPEPPDRVGAQFSIHFSLALAVVKGKNDFNTLMTVDLKDPQVVNMAKRVRPVADKEADAEDRKGHNWAGVTVVTKDGRRFSKAQLASGSAENPLSQGEVESKFRELASTVLEHDKVEELIGLCGHLEDVADSSRVVKCLATVDITKQPKIHHA